MFYFVRRGGGRRLAGGFMLRHERNVATDEPGLCPLRGAAGVVHGMAATKQRKVWLIQE